MKYAMLLCLALSGCGVGLDPAPQDKTMSVRLSVDAVPPSPFVLGPSGTQPVPVSAPVVTFVTGPVVGPVAVVNPPLVVVGPTPPVINWCTDGFVIGPCVPVNTCRPDAAGFVAGPCGG
jgi:hypothetical protein